MIVVNSPGGDETYAWVAHSPWNGLTPADLVFPAFLFSMGVSVAFSLRGRLELGESRSVLIRHILKRTALIFGLGLLVSATVSHPAEGLRLTGVLQRIAACYLLASLLTLKTSPRARTATIAFLLAGYWALMTFTPVPGFGPGVLTPEGNLASWLDRRLLGGHLYAHDYDLEGLLGTLPALATALIGVLAGDWLRSPGSPERKAAGLFKAGVGCAAAGLAWSPWFPINKTLWTSSYALVTAGVGLAALAFCFWAVELRQAAFWTKPFEVFGRNSLLAYVLSGLFYGAQEFAQRPMPDGSPGDVKLWLTAKIFGSWLGPKDASLAYALACTLLCLAVLAVFQSKRSILKG